MCLNIRFRLCKYEIGDFFKKHIDGYYEESNLCKSIFTMNLYLNDNFTGGETKFFKPKYIYQPKQGDCILFNHLTQEYLHSGEILTSGVKYLLRTEVMLKSILK